MNLYGILIAFVVGMALGGSWMKEWKDGQIAKHEQAMARVGAEIQAAADAAEQVAANKIIDMEAAYIAGEANAKIVVQKVYVKGQSYVSSQPVFQNPACVVPADGMLAINRARASLRTTTDSADIAPSVPAAGAAEGRPAGNAVPASPSGHGTVGPMPAPARPTDSGGQVPGPSVRPVPKPKPVV